MTTQPQGEVSSPDGAARPEPLRVLVIDRDADNLGALVTMLAREGMAPVAASDCASARALAGSVPRVDVVVGEVCLPDCDGREVMAEMRERYGSKAIVVSAQPPPPRRHPQDVPDLWLTKPIPWETLRAALRVVLRPSG